MTERPIPGEGVDKHGNPVVDPTRNVLDLVKAAIQRQDDLREEQDRRIEARIAGFEKLSDSRHIATSQELQAVERRRLEHKEDTKSGVDAAFSAAKEAVKEQAASSDKAITKSEVAVNGQITGVQANVDDLKTRIGRLETILQTKTDVREDSRSSIGTIVGISGALFGLVGVISAIAIAAINGAG